MNLYVLFEEFNYNGFKVIIKYKFVDRNIEK